ncbi:DUF222 domain-containing protein [Gordonia sp. DT218]|uniref:HNH endonuclease n=1 Tax=Gordonia sp. DT218 TaxID=3416659 RepID=UPI003CF059FB
MSVAQLVPADDASSSIFDDTRPEDLSDDEIADRLVGYASQVAAMTARFLDLLAAFDDRSAWGGDGILSCAHWLTWRTGLSIRTAQDHLRVAHAVPALPLIREAFSHGRLSYSKVRALTRVATPEREQELLNVAMSSTAAQVERLVRKLRHIDRHAEEEERGQIDSRGSWRWNDDGSLSVNLRLSPLDGARFLAGAVRAEYERTRIGGDPDVPTPTDPASETPSSKSAPDLWRNVPSDIAPAVIAMADTVQTVIEVPEFVPGAEVVVHDDVDEPHIDGGPALDRAEVDEARCGGTERRVRRGKRGVVLTWGRKRRMPTRALMRIIFERDRCCRVPGCGRTRHLHAHHVQFVSHGGTTEPDNLILLCSTHHRALHRGEFSIRALGEQQFSFHRSDGSIIDDAPPMRAPDDWHPDSGIDDDAVLPINPGRRLDLGYTTEVLHAVWAWKAQKEAEQAEAVAA